jgi:dihydrofolate synthase / folylpolyglutamate synthase
LDPLSYLFRLEQFGIKFGLDNIRALLARIGNPQQTFRSIHIAGTNGKGSVTAMIDSVLRRAGHRSARYTSPHIVDLSERFVIDGQPVAAAEMRQSAELVQSAIEALIADGTLSGMPTFFEATTAMAFDLFRNARVEFAVVEVGLGGRLDSTNVIEPIVTAITSIDFDHQQYLGDTLGKIAAEKAGIIKPNVPVVIGNLQGEAYDMIARIARDRGADLIHSDDISKDFGEIRVGLRGDHQRANAAVAICVLETLRRLGVAIEKQAILDGLATVTWPGRLDHRRLPDGHEIILDAAHNPAGARALASYLRGLGRDRPTLVFGVMRDKDVDGMLTELLPEVGRVIVTQPSNARAARPEELAARIRALAPAISIDVIATPHDAVQSAIDDSSLVVIAGSIFLLADVIQEIGA